MIKADSIDRYKISNKVYFAVTDGWKPPEKPLVEYKKKYEMIRYKGPDDLVKCDVCLEMIADPCNELLYCDLCDFCVHRDCYGSELKKGIPEGNLLRSIILFEKVIDSAKDVNSW